MKPEVELINVYHCYYGKIHLMSNISKTVRDTIMMSIEVE